MDSKTEYIVKSSEEYLGEKGVIMNNLIPKFNKYEENKIREDVSNDLFRVFKKYV